MTESTKSKAAATKSAAPKTEKVDVDASNAAMAGLTDPTDKKVGEATVKADAEEVSKVGLTPENVEAKGVATDSLAQAPGYVNVGPLDNSVTEDVELPGTDKKGQVLGSIQVPGGAGDLYEVKEDVIEERDLPGTDRKTSILVAHKGQVITKGEAARLGLK